MITIINRFTAWKMGVDLTATGQRIRRYRRLNNFSQEYLSRLFEEAGESASRVTISNWENGKTMPSLAHVVFLSELFGCSLDELVLSFRRSRETEGEDQGQPVLVYPPPLSIKHKLHFVTRQEIDCRAFFIYNSLRCSNRRQSKA